MTSMDPANPPRSRRERPAKPALTRQGIIDAALAILRDEGLNKVTMRRISTALDTGPASLYVYVRDTEDLHAQILDALLGPLSARPGAPDDQPQPWRDRLKALLTDYRNVLFAHPEIARMALSTQPSGPNYMALVEALLALLAEGRVADHAAAWGVDLLLLYPTAIAVEHSGPKQASRKTQDFSALAAKVPAVDAMRFPHIARLNVDLMSGDGAARSDWALDVLLDGILAAASRAPR